jgi:hypothetical protein
MDNGVGDNNAYCFSYGNAYITLSKSLYSSYVITNKRRFLNVKIGGHK